uniref:Ribonuclease H-like domain-containing protein n=1 Tax=Tanacetum cinerariifolium TaxID=118510 RepID=A0A699H960_TANCI|nr:ribonuclease H-like domain-containing protein [Tanacetum cinerariifolium]
MYLGHVFSDNAATVWRELQETYDRVDGSIVFNLMQKINSFKQGGLLVSEYYYKLNSLWREFDILTKLPDCTCAARNELSEHAKNPNLKPAHGFSNSKSNNVEVKKGSGGTRESKTSGRSIVSLTNEQVMKLMSLLNEKSCFTAQANMTNIKSCSFFNCNVFLNQHFYKFFCVKVNINGVNYHLGWRIDSGANQHITNSTKNMFNIVDVIELKLTVGHPNGNLAQITHVGSSRLNNDVVLFDVLVVPEYYVTLLSVHKLIKDSKLVVTFDECKCLVQDLKMWRVLATGSEFGGLYVFDNDYNKCASVNQREFFICHVSKDVWHNRIGHPTNHVLQLLKGSLNLNHINHEIPYESCQKAKQIREPFPLSKNKSTFFGQLIHLDVWGPYRMVNKEGFRLPSSVLNGKSPFYLVYGKEPNLSHLRSFGCLCYAGIIKESDKFSSRSEKCVLIGYVGGKKACKLFSLESRNVLYSRDVKFYETIFPYKMSSIKIGFDNGKVSDVSSLIFFYFVESETTPKTSSPNDEDVGTSGRDGSMHQPDVESDGSGDNPVYTNEVSLRRSKRSSKLPEKLNDYVLDKKVKYGLNRYVNHHVLNIENYCFVSNMNGSSEPSSFEEASKDKEMNALYENATWELVDLPVGRKPIGSKCVYKIRLKSTWDIERYKARVVTNGFNQKEGIDYDETFSLVVKIGTKKYCLEMSHEYGLLACRPVISPPPENCVLSHKESDGDKYLRNITSYQKLIGKLIYLTMTRLDISYKSKKWVTLCKSSAEAEYKAMASATCEVMWVLKVLQDLDLDGLAPVTLYCDNKSAIQIAANPMMHEKTKRFDIDVHLIRETVASGLIKTEKVDSKSQVADILTKALGTTQHIVLSKKIGLVTMFVS